MKTKHPTKGATATLTVRVPVKLKSRLEWLARSRDTNRSRVAVEALENYIDDQELHGAKVDQGIRDADAGRVVPHEQVKRYLHSWGRKAKRPRPAWK
jgi:predicted transcriptional regulator